MDKQFNDGNDQNGNTVDMNGNDKEMQNQSSNDNELHPYLKELPSALSINFDKLTQKPWEEPDADISDYFNYGFDEETFKIYQNKVRDHFTQVDMQAINAEIKQSDYDLNHDKINFILPHECGGVGRARNQENFYIEEDDVPVLCKFF